jgi:hypothetical protein
MSKNKLRYITAKIGHFDKVFTELAFTDYVANLNSKVRWHENFGLQDMAEILSKKHDEEHGDAIELIYDDAVRSGVVIKARRVTVVKKIREF